MYISWQSVITLAAVLGALVAIIGYARKLIKFVDHQSDQDRDIKEIKEEQLILTKGILACLKGLKEQGCNGPVTKAINEIEEHLNEQAHK